MSSSAGDDAGARSIVRVVPFHTWRIFKRRGSVSTATGATIINETGHPIETDNKRYTFNDYVDRRGFGETFIAISFGI